MNKKAAIPFVPIILGLIILAIVLINFAGRECNKNAECGADSYCGSDYKCHAYPDEVIVEKYNFVWPAIIVGIAVIIAALIQKGKKIPFVKW